MWDFFLFLRHRHSIRKYQPDMAVEPEKLSAILEMACAAPSAGDLQAYRIIVVRDLADRQMLVNSCHQQNFIAEAPVCLVFCADPARSESVFSERGAKLYALQDATIAATYAQLAIVAAGMGSTWVGYFEEDKLREILKLESGLVPVALLSLGYPAELPEPSSRRRLDEVVAWR